LNSILQLFLNCELKTVRILYDSFWEVKIAERIPFEGNTQVVHGKQSGRG
jgi:hypothetical protein